MAQQNTIKIKPARNGLVVRDPRTGEPLDPRGQLKPRSNYWMRRLRDGDVVDVNARKRSASKTDSKKED